MVLNSRAKRLSDSTASILLDDENAAEPRLQILTTVKVVPAKGGGAEDFGFGMSYPSDRRRVAVHVPAKDSDP